jgi:hypothetical protein
LTTIVGHIEVEKLIKMEILHQRTCYLMKVRCAELVDADEISTRRTGLGTAEELKLPRRVWSS